MSYQISAVNSRVNDPMIARRLEILETATASNDAFEPQPPLNVWQVRRVNALEDQFFDTPRWQDLNTRCELLVLDWKSADDLTTQLLTEFTDAARFFYAAGWHAAVSHQGPLEALRLALDEGHDTEAHCRWSQTETHRTMRQWSAEWPLQWSGSSEEFRAALDIVKRRDAAEQVLAHAIFQDAWLDYVALTTLQNGGTR